MEKPHHGGGVRGVADAAAVSIDGYLRNASKRVRVPSASGGRGTRRKLAMVTAAHVEQPSQEAVYVDAVKVDDEWDEVVLPNALIPVVKKDEEKAKKEEESAPVKTDVSLPPPMEGTIKAEAIPADDDSNDDDDDHAAQSMMEGTRPPLADTPLRRWGQRDPAYERMLEQQQLLAAQRRSERIRHAAEGMSALILALQRAKMIVKESKHPKLVRALLHLRINKDNVEKVYPLLDAVREAKKNYELALNPVAKKPTLSPCWVTTYKDTVNNHTSASIMSILNGIKSVFFLNDSVNADILSNWAASIELGYFYKLLLNLSLSPDSSNPKITVPHSLYMCIIFIALSTVSGLSCRLVMSVRKNREGQVTSVANNNSGENGNSNEKTKEIMMIFLPHKKRRENSSSVETEPRSRKLPSSCFWVEVWCPQRECFISVNPCEGCTTLWGSPYTFSIGGDVIMDVTPRYSVKYSTAFSHRWGRCDQFRFFWKNLKWDDNREASEVVLDSFRKNISKKTEEQLMRERKQLHSLMYAEEIPKTLTSLQRHPLFVLENEIARYEGIHPKDNTTIVGSVKGHTVYKRSAIVNLRSRDGWLRVGRCLINEEETPYKVVPPPASRPFSSPSAFFGVWQTKPFEPLPLRSDGTLPLHGRTHWYIVLDKPIPPGLVHIREPNIARVARRVGVEFGLAVMGFRRRRLSERRFAPWETLIDGIVVKETDSVNILHAYNDWKQLTEEQEAAKRRQRSNCWWMHFAQRLLATQRVREQYLEGAMHGAFPTR
ncbi:putative DNA-repair protein [Trypanosoma theileri]|uniref:Putative DNA-repair protein n=1 Tax=Trypanosoma theileri TaxID=67003 RepID=A0A1X0P5A4_9TRYP|nr:putative DNA-repair protein [Trypanosoma theileri]ORC92117.1 putative DNA-repair protein [Trypanosoma theileri]